MKSFARPLFAFALVAVALVAAAPAAAQAPINIIYPIHGETYPPSDPAPPALSSLYFPASFSVTCSGDHTVSWGFDSSPAIGSALFYDTFSGHFVFKLAGGSHKFWVDAPGCGYSEVKFQIGN